MSYEAKLRELGYPMTVGTIDTGRFLRAVQTGNLVYTSGHTSEWKDEVIKGKIGADLTIEQGYRAAQLSTLACLRAVKSVVGSLDRVVRIVKVLGMVNVAPDFDSTPDVIHGCSDLLLEVFGPSGQHARSAVGMVIPYNYAVEIEMIVEVSDA